MVCSSLHVTFWCHESLMSITKLQSYWLTFNIILQMQNQTKHLLRRGMWNLLALPTQKTDSVAVRHNSHTSCSEKQVVEVYRVLQAGAPLQIINCYLHLLTFFFFSASVEEKTVEESLEEKFWMPARPTFITGLGESVKRTLAYRHLICRDKQRERKTAINLIGSYNWLAYLDVLLFLLTSTTEICKTEMFKYLYN